MMTRTLSALLLLSALACSSTYEGADGTGGQSNDGTSGGSDSSGTTSGGGSPSAGGTSSTGGSVGGSGGTALAAQALCVPALSDANRQLVADAIDLLFVEEDIGAVELYFEDPYLQHNPIAASGTATLTAVMGPIISGPSFSYERLRTFAECDLVVVQGEYSGSGVVFDLFRVEGGKIVEHWDSDAGRASEASGTAPLTDREQTDDHRVLVEELFARLVGGAPAAELSRFFGESFVSHRATGNADSDAWLLFLEGEEIDHQELHRIVSDGNYVFTLAEGTIGGVPYALYDLFRLDEGVIVEHWDSSRVVPGTTESGLPIF